ncbi:MAG: hypothetical protein N3B13_01920, partial [Deltaproteobacteria bacterium]|nr:hypothetical protein [Deltaproteobacteria bacterium]
MSERVRTKGIKIRIFILIGMIFCIVVLIVHRASGLQIKEVKKYSGLALSQHEKAIELTPKRGTISDRNGVELAITVERFSLFVKPQKFADENEKKFFAHILSEMLRRPEKEFLKLFNDDRPFVWVQRLMDENTAMKIRGASGFSEKEFEKKGDLKKLISAIRERLEIKMNSDFTVGYLNSLLNERYLYSRLSLDKTLYSRMTQTGNLLLKEVRDFGRRELNELTGYEREQLRALNRYLIELIFPSYAPKNPFFYTNAFGLIKENKRAYPQRQLASHIIGFTNVDQE